MLGAKMEISEILQKLGDPGLYQIILYICLWLCNSTVSLNHLIMAVYGYTPKHSCKLPPGYLKNESASGSCQIYEDYNKTSGNTVDCSGTGYTFDLNGKESTIVNEWSLVCDDKYLIGTATTIYFAGVMLGGAIFGQLADKFGRKPILLCCMYGHIVLGVSIYFVPTYEGFVAIRFFLGFLIQGIQTSSYVLLVEMTVSKYRPLCAGIFEVCWAVGNLWMASLAWMIQDWRKIQLALCLPSLVTLSFLFFVPESFRWLLNQRQHKKAEFYVRKIASFNKKMLPDELSMYVGASQDEAINYSFHDLFLTPNIRKRTILMGYIWLASSIGYYGLSLSARGLAGNRYSNLFISALVEVVAFISVIFILKYFSRRRPLMVYYILGGVTCIVAGSVKDTVADGETIARIFAIIGKFFISAAFSTIFLFTVELFPTVVRTLGMGSCVFWARVGGMIAPQILLLKNYTFNELPYLIFGGLSLIAAVAIYFIPETRGIKLPETIGEIETTKLAMADDAEAIDSKL